MIRAPADPALASLEIKPLWQAREHIPLLALWLWEEWGRARGHALEEAEDWLSDLARADQGQTGRVALSDGAPLGVALLRDEDLESRKDLSPWLSSLFVEPSARKQGVGARLVRGIEQAAIEREVPILYLYTLHWTGFYAKLGWSLIETLRLAEGEASLMCRRLLKEEEKDR